MFLRILWLPVWALALAGCAGMSEQACLVSDWRTVGFEDGAAGRSVATIGNYRQACGKHGVAPDLDSYRAGHADGVMVYCRPSQGFEAGRSGASYQGVCPVELEGDFLASFNSGHRLYELESAVRQADAEIASNTSAQAQIKRELTEIAIRIAADATPAEERVRLVARAAELGQKHGELVARNASLHEARAVQQRELEQYRATLAARL